MLKKLKNYSTKNIILEPNGNGDTDAEIIQQRKQKPIVD